MTKASFDHEPTLTIEEKEMVRKLEVERLRPYCPQKMTDMGEFILHLTIEGRIHQCIIDSGSAGSIFPSSLYDPELYPPLKPAEMDIGLANGTSVEACGKMEDVIVKIAGHTILLDFVVLHMDDPMDPMPARIILGREFMITTRAVQRPYLSSMTLELNNLHLTFSQSGALLRSLQIQTRDEIKAWILKKKQAELVRNRRKNRVYPGVVYWAK